MKKSLWLLLVVAALIAVFAVAGCLQGTTPEEPTEPEEPTTPTPTDYCPTTWTTSWQKIYADPTVATDQFKIYITFDQPVWVQDLACFQNPNSWAVYVKRYVPYRRWDSNYSTWVDKVYNAATSTEYLTATITSVALQSDNKTVVLTGYVHDEGTADADDADDIDGSGSVDGDFYGLICSEADYNAYITEFDEGAGNNDLAATTGTKYADVISWKYTGTNTCGVIYDAQGNACADLCTISGELCCQVEYCETCDTTTNNCPIGGICD